MYQSNLATQSKEHDMNLEGYVKTEKIDGVIYCMSPSAHFRHGVINGNIFHSLYSQMEGTICRPFLENLDLYISDDEWLIPDIMIVCNPRDIHKNKYKGIPKLVVETLSPSTSKRDKGIKMRKYQQIGVPEYWIIGAIEKSIDIYYLTDGVLELAESYIFDDDPDSEDYNAETVITLSQMPHIRIKLSEIFREFS